jgi:hypothetical protein
MGPGTQQNSPVGPINNIELLVEGTQNVIGTLTGRVLQQDSGVSGKIVGFIVNNTHVGTSTCAHRVNIVSIFEQGEDVHNTIPVSP